jgi:thiamine transporter
MKNNRVKLLTESAIMVALASVLSMLKIWQSPYGGSVTLLSMVPIILLSCRRGIKVGLLAGFVYSLIQLLQGLGNLSWIPTSTGVVLCALLDYILPFTLLGLGGLFRNKPWGAVLGALLVTVLRFACHTIVGVAVWYELDLLWYADDPTHIVNLYGPWLFSMIYSAIYMVPEIIATSLGTGLLHKALKKVNI